MRIHLIAIGGSVMHNLAIALHKKGHQVSGSDDEVFEPAKSNLGKYGLLPEELGWFPEKITKELEVVILGMHAKPDNPELLQAQKLGVQIYSYPEFIYEQSKDKKRVVIGGSHGKTTITSMIMHVLKELKKDFDYLVGAKIDGFDTMVKVTNEAPIIILEGDEYLASPIDRRPKFHLYHPDISVLSGIAWDHINVFPTYENYLEQFEKFIEMITEDGTLIYCQEDSELVKLVEASKNKIKKISYTFPEYIIKNGDTWYKSNGKQYPLSVFGKHNLLNMQAAKLACGDLGINEEDFLRSITTFKGASKRLELIFKNKKNVFYKDFAHSPSKVEATIKALKEQFPERKLIAFLELHTYSSLNETFLKEYKNTMNLADDALVYYDSHALQIKQLPDIDKEYVKNSFNHQNIRIFTTSKEITTYLENQNWDNTNLLMMSSGNFGGIDLVELSRKLFK